MDSITGTTMLVIFAAIATIGFGASAAIGAILDAKAKAKAVKATPQVVKDMTTTRTRFHYDGRNGLCSGYIRELKSGYFVVDLMIDNSLYKSTRASSREEAIDLLFSLQGVYAPRREFTHIEVALINK